MGEIEKRPAPLDATRGKPPTVEREDRKDRESDNDQESAPPSDPEEDIVTYASWESFPASDAPAWR